MIALLFSVAPATPLFVPVFCHCYRYCLRGAAPFA